jgi:hypothetical protein
MGLWQIFDQITQYNVHTLELDHFRIFGSGFGFRVFETQTNPKTPKSVRVPMYDGVRKSAQVFNTQRSFR